MLLPKLNIDDNPIYSVVEPSIENGENSEYSISFQSDLTDGLYSIFGEDDAGNKSIINDEQTFIIDNSQPTLPRIILRNTDSGKSDTDLNTNNTRPEVVFAAEEGLTVYLENITTSTSLQPIVSGSGDFSYVYTPEGNYIIFMNRDLETGDYRVFVRDDAGNQNEEGLGNDVFRMDVTAPSFETSIDLGDFDKGRSNNDKITNIVRPEVVFKSEEGLSVNVLYLSDNSEAPISLDQNLFSVVLSNQINLSDNQKTIFDTMPEVSSIDPYPTLGVYTVSQENITAQPDVGINAGNYSLIGDSNTGWKLQPMVISGSNINIGSSSLL